MGAPSHTYRLPALSALRFLQRWLVRILFVTAITTAAGGSRYHQRSGFENPGFYAGEPVVPSILVLVWLALRFAGFPLFAH
jgi:hypothetical protein